MKLIKNFKLKKLAEQNLNWDDSNPETNGEYFMLSNLGSEWRLCLDIGANRGDYTKKLRDAAPDAKIISFEPNPNAAKHIKQGKKVKVEVVAVGDNHKELLINFNENDDTQSSTYRTNEYTRPIKTPQITIDGYLSDNKISSVDFVKIDTEGHELAVIKGAKAAIKDHKIKMIQFEYGGTYKDAGTTLKEIYGLLTKNYIVCQILSKGVLPLKYHEGLETYRYSNWLAISREA